MKRALDLCDAMLCALAARDSPAVLGMYGMGWDGMEGRQEEYAVMYGVCTIYALWCCALTASLRGGHWWYWRDMSDIVRL